MTIHPLGDFYLEPFKEKDITPSCVPIHERVERRSLKSQYI
jgi:hypothetical protein